MTKLLFILLLLFGCSPTESSCSYDNNQCNECYENNNDFSCLFGDWVSSNGNSPIAYYTINEQSFIFRNALTCSGIIGDLKIVEFDDSCLSTNFSFELANLLYSFKLVPDNENSMILNLNTAGLDDCLMDTLIRMESEIPCND